MNSSYLNLQSPQQAQEAQDEESLRNIYLNDLCSVLSQPEGQRVLMRILTDLGLCTTILQQSAKIYAAAALHDAALCLLTDIAKASPQHFTEIMRLQLLRNINIEEKKS